MNDIITIKAIADEYEAIKTLKKTDNFDPEKIEQDLMDDLAYQIYKELMYDLDEDDECYPTYIEDQPVIYINSWCQFEVYFEIYNEEGELIKRL